jgi:hypothetical protein
MTYDYIVPDVGHGGGVDGPVVGQGFERLLLETGDGVDLLVRVQAVVAVHCGSERVKSLQETQATIGHCHIKT